MSGKSGRLSSIDMRRLPIILRVAALCFSSLACRQISDGKNNVSPIVGAWFVKTPEAPFPFHMFVFHSDGTMQQANPEAGNSSTSDSNGMGVWIEDGKTFRGKLVEITADQETRQFVSRGEISFSIKVNGGSLSGKATANFYDAEGRRSRGPVAARRVPRCALAYTRALCSE